MEKKKHISNRVVALYFWGSYILFWAVIILLVYVLNYIPGK